jgi:hypothetical protein
MNETDINIEGDMVVISQTADYRGHTIEFPVAAWPTVKATIEAELDEFFMSLETRDEPNE